MLFDIGACCDCEGGSTITVARCGGTGATNVGIEGVRVVVKRLGATIFDGDTDAEGKVKLTLPAASVTYNVELYPGASNFRYKDTTTTFSPSTIPANVVVRPNPADGFRCVFPDVHPLSNELLVSLPDGDYTVRYTGVAGLAGWTGPWGRNTTFADANPVYAQVSFVWDCGRTVPTRLSLIVTVNPDLSLLVTARWGETIASCVETNYDNFGGTGGGESQNASPPPGSLPLYGSGVMVQTKGVLPNPTGGNAFVVAEVLP